MEDSEGRQIAQSGRTVEEAVEQALRAFGVSREAVYVEVLDEGNRGVFGLGAKEARVLVTLKESPLATLKDSPAPLKAAAGVVQTLATDVLTLMGMDTALTVREEPDAVKVDITGKDVGMLIGKRGQTLAAIESVLGMMTVRQVGQPVRVEVDVEGYRDRRRRALEIIALKAAARVARHGKEIALDPMEARDRRIIHTVLQDHPEVTTVSRGEAQARRVVVMPTESAPRERPPGPATQAPGPPGEGRARGSASATPSSRSAGRPPGREGRPDTPRRTWQERSAPFRSRGPAARPRPSQGGRPGREAGGPPPRSGRPDGLPVDEELEAEIEAHLAKTRRRPGSTSDGESGADPAPTP